MGSKIKIVQSDDWRLHRTNVRAIANLASSEIIESFSLYTKHTPQSQKCSHKTLKKYDCFEFYMQSHTHAFHLCIPLYFFTFRNSAYSFISMSNYVTRILYSLFASSSTFQTKKKITPHTFYIIRSHLLPLFK